MIKLILLFWSLLVLLPLEVIAQNNVDITGSQVGGDVIGGDQINVAPQEVKSLLKRVSGEWILSSYKHSPVVDGKQDPLYGGLFYIRDGNGTLSVSNTGKFVWELIVHDGFRKNSDHTRIRIIQTSKMRPNGALEPVLDSTQNLTHHFGDTEWQHNERETSMALRGYNFVEPDEVFTVSTDENGDFMEIKNRRSTFVWVKR